ncbi:MAG: hypothetical protein SGARI_005527, partial [Bacillariaceae sp.]
MHNKAMKAYEEEQKRKQAAAKAAAAAAARSKKRSRPKKTGAEKASPAKKVAAATVANGAAAAAVGTSGATLEWEGRPQEELEGGWPEGWVKRTFVRNSGNSAGTKDSYWFTPVENFKLRSITEVKAFLWALEKNNGDEKLARQASKRKPRKKAKVEPQPQSEQAASEFTAANTTTVASPVAATATTAASPAAAPAPAANDPTVVVQVGQKPEEAPPAAAKLGTDQCDV